MSQTSTMTSRMLLSSGYSNHRQGLSCLKVFSRQINHCCGRFLTPRVIDSLVHYNLLPSDTPISSVPPGTPFPQGQHGLPSIYGNFQRFLEVARGGYSPALTLNAGVRRWLVLLVLYYCSCPGNTMLADPYVQVLGQITPGNKIECPWPLFPNGETRSPLIFFD